MGSTQDVSWSRPFGNSWLGNALQGNPNAPLNPDGTSKETGEQVIVPGTQGSSTTNTPQFGGGFVQSAMSSSNSNTSGPYGSGPSAFARPMNNTTGEDAFRSAYLGALKPNTAFTFNAQNPATFGVPTKGGK